MRPFLFLAVWSWLSAGVSTLPASAQDPAPATQTAQTFTKDGKQLKYWLWLPKSAPAEGAPLLLSLHGSGERGDDLEKVKKHGPVKLVETLPDAQPFILVTPQCPAGQRWDIDLLRDLVEEVAARHGADRSRLTLTGLSMGGYATWAMTAKYPDLFAAALPICGGGNPDEAAKIKHLPIRVYHGAKDEAVPIERSREMVAALKKAGATDVELTVFPDLAHDSWTPVYADPETYAWLLKQRKK